MPSPEPPLNTTRIMKVLEPEGGFYVVVVRVDPSVAARFPDKPFNLPIEDKKLGLNLAKRESELYAGYALVSIEPAENGGKDQFWYFQKLDGPVWGTVAKSRENLTPQKFRSSVVTTTTEQEVDPDTTPTTLSGDLVLSQVERTPNTGKSVRKEVTETINENASPLVGEEYGDIVTKSVSESLVSEGTAADTGIDVISSVVEPLGNGKAVKQTKRAKSPGWPDPLDKEVTKENGNSPPASYTRDITRTRTSRKIAPSAIPDAPALTGNQVGKAYKKETQDRAEEVITTQTLTLNTSAIDEAFEQKPFVTIRSRMTPGTSAVLPSTGNGSAKLVYEAPDGSKIYENTAEIATARPGPAGVEKDVKPYGTFTTAKSYSLGNAVSTPTGSSNVVFNDGAVLIYELGEITFSPTYQDIGVEIEKQAGFTRTTRSRYSGSNAVGTALGSASISYTDGVSVVFEVKEITLQASGSSFDGGKQSSRLYTKSVTTTYGTSSVGSGENYDSDVVITDGTTTIYRVNSTTVTAKAPLIYDSVVRDNIPSRLISIDLIPIARRDDRSQISVFVNIEEGYTGAFPARVTEFYTEDPQAVAGFVPITMKPTAISYQGILFNLSIGETLHSAFTLRENIGTSDPDYLPQTLTKVVPATEPVQVPSGYQPFAVSLEPFESGFLVKKIEIKYR